MSATGDEAKEPQLRVARSLLYGYGTPHTEMILGGLDL